MEAPGGKEEGTARCGRVFGADKGRCSGNYPPPGSLYRDGDDRGGRGAGMFRALGSQGWERGQDLELPGAARHMQRAEARRLGLVVWL